MTENGGPRPYTQDEVARGMMHVCEQFSRQYPGTIFMFVSGLQETGELTKMGLSTNLESTDAVMHFLKLILMQHEGAKITTVPDEVSGTET